jgi:hypothetical protein
MRREGLLLGLGNGQADAGNADTLSESQRLIPLKLRLYA